MNSEIIPNPVGKSRFSLLARAGGLRPYSPTLQGAGFYRPLTTEFRIKSQYEQDFYGWTQWQIEVLANREVSEIDWQNLQEELQGLGRQEYRELVSRMTVLLGHLLNWEFQPENRSRSWFLTIREQRRAIHRHLYRNPSLKSRIADALEDGFEAGVDLALRETNLPLRTFPEQCPYRFEEAMTESFICDTSQDWE